MSGYDGIPMATAILKATVLSAIVVVGLTAAAAAQQPGPQPSQPYALQAHPTEAPQPRADAVPGLTPVTFEEILKGRPASTEYSLMAIAVGAVAGVVAFNALLPAFGISAVTAVATGAPLTAAGLEAALAASRLYAVAGGAAGAVVGQMMYWSMKAP